MGRLVITIGLPGSGKTTWAKQKQREEGNWKIVCRDDLRWMLDDYKYSGKNEGVVSDIQESIITMLLQKGYNIICADTNLNPDTRKRMNKLGNNIFSIGSDGNKHKVDVTVEEQSFLEVTLEECIKRDLVRPNSVGEKVIRGMYNQYIAPSKRVGVKQDESKPKAIIVDMDGTLAIHNGRNPYDAMHCDSDLLNTGLETIMRSLHTQGVKVLLVSAREERTRKPTEAWLAKHGVDYHEFLIMRRDDDFRPDDDVKRELFNEKINPHYNIICCFDDRKRVIRLWRSMGLLCADVGEDYEF